MFWLSQNGSQMFCPQKISEKWEIKVCEASSVPACAPPHAVCCSVALLAVQHLCVSPGCDVCQWFHYARTFSLGSVPGYPPAGNCVSLSCLLLGLFWLFVLFVCLFVFVFAFLVFLYTSLGSHGKYTEVVSHSLLQCITVCQNSPLQPVHLGGMAWLIVSRDIQAP